MSDSEKLKLACDTLKQAIDKSRKEKDFKSKWLEMKSKSVIKTRF